MSRSYLARRRRRRPSFAEVHNAKSEYEVQARIRARAEARQVPREFILYTPEIPEPHASGRSKPRPVRDEDGVLRTSSLPLIIGELSLALKDNQKNRRAQQAAHESGTTSHTPSRTPPEEKVFEPPIHIHDYMMPPTVSSSRGPGADTARDRRRGKKGKQRADRPVSGVPPPQVSKTLSDSELDRAWWLDVANPTWEDMRAIGKV